MRIDVLTLFPDMFHGVLGSSILKRAADPSLHAGASGRLSGESSGKPSGEPSGGGPPVTYHVTDIRDHTTNKHDKVDRPPYGGGPGMVIQCQPVWDAVKFVEAQDAHVKPTRVLLSPQGVPLTQPLVEALARRERLLLIAGHYEGIDERVIEALTDDGGLMQVSLGDYVLSGGELPAMVLIDAVVRLLPGVLGDDTSAEHESFSAALGGGLDYPHYTRPPQWMGRAVPDVLLSGHHAQIEAWRREQSKRRTRERRPDLGGS